MVTQRRRGSRSLLDTVSGLLPLGLLILLWQVFGSVDSPSFPAPSTWWPAMFQRGQGDQILPAVGETMTTFGTALAGATIIGVAVGVAVGSSRTADRALGPTFEFARALPPAAMVPVATLLLGFDELMKIVVVTTTALWPILLNTRTGVHGIDPVVNESARSLRLSRSKTIFSVLLPSVAPSVMVGVRVATPIALVITLLVEYLTAVNGLGALVGDAQRTFQPARVYALIVVAGLISLVVNSAVRAIENSIWRRRSTSPAG